MSQRKRTRNLKQQGLKGPVKQLRQTTYTVAERDGQYIPGQLSSHATWNQFCSYTREGILTEERLFTIKGDEYVTRYTPTGQTDSCIQYGEEGEMVSSSAYFYNKADYLTDMRTERMVNGTVQLSESKWIYDDRNYLTGFITTLDGKQQSRTTFANDDAGNVIEQLMYDQSDKLHRKIENAYNAEGRTVSQKDYNGELELMEETTYEYTPDGQISRTCRNGKYTDYNYERREPEREYDHHQNWIKEEAYDMFENEFEVPENFKFREITYYNEPSENTDLRTVRIINDRAMIRRHIPRTPVQNPLSPKAWQWVAEGMDKYEPFSTYRYYTALHGFFPSRGSIYSYEADLWSLRRYLIRHFGASEVFNISDGMHNLYDEQHKQFVLAFPRNKYLLEADDIQHIGSYHYGFAGEPEDTRAEISNYVQFGSLYLYYPAAGLGERDEDFERELDNIVQSFRVKKKEEIPQVSMITMLGTSFSLKAYPVKDDFVIKDLDLNYGNGFEKFHSGLMEKFSTTKQGLVLFHGEPGTGKTFYVRHLLRKMTESKKVVIYMPPNMVDHLVEPSFMTFISTQVANFTAAGKSCIMLIEDAEPLLVARDANIRIQGITNLLNMTDGLLNDMLGLQIICTFNVPLKALDKALLRPGRLIARKEFKALPEFEANVLAHSIGIKHVFKGPATLSDIYAKAADKKMLTHDE